MKPSEITEFLATHHIQIESNSNAKVIDEHVELVLAHFAPEMNVDNANPSTQPGEKETHAVETDAEAFSEKEEEIETPDDVGTPDDEIETHEVIKPIKVELPGLKVVGKIDLPEPKKKEENLPEDNEGQSVKGENNDSPEQSATRSSRSDNRRTGRPKRENDRRPRKNPIALQREREEREALRKKLEKQEKEKELRTKRYLKKVSAKASPPKPIQKMKNDEEYETYSEEATKPKSLFGKILNWFVSE